MARSLYNENDEIYQSYHILSEIVTTNSILLAPLYEVEKQAAKLL